MNNNRGIIISIIILFSVIIILNTVIAEETELVSLPGKTADSFKCKIDFTISYIGSLSLVGANLSSYSEKLNADLFQLDALVSAGNRSAFKDFIKNTFEPNFKAAREAVHKWRKDNYKNLTKEQKASLKESYQSAKKAFEDCHKKSLLDHGNQRVELFEKILAQYKERTDRLAAKGLDTSGMNKVIEDAKAQVVEPLKSALADANDSQSIKNILRKYCLFNGCKNGVNYHLAAKYEIERLSATLAFVKSKLNNTEFNAKVAEAESNLNSAKGLLTEVGNTHYNDNGKQIWNKIRSSYEILKNINKSAKESIKEAKKEENKT